MKLLELIGEYTEKLSKGKRNLTKTDLIQYRDYLIKVNGGNTEKDFVLTEDIKETVLIDFVGDYLLRKVKLDEKSYVSVLKNFRGFFLFLIDGENLSKKQGKQFVKILDYYISAMPILKKFEYRLRRHIEETLESLKSIKEIRSSFVTIDRVENGELWLDSMAEKREIGPFIVPQRVYEMARKGFAFECEYAKTSYGYYFVFVGNVYPEGFEYT